MEPASNPSVIVASLDLQLVQLLRGAMRAADLAAAKTVAGVPVACDRFERQCEIEPEPRFLPRRVIEPTPRIEPRPVIHPTPRIEPLPSVPCEPVSPTPCDLKSPIEPPWKTLPWQNPPPPMEKIKLLVRKPDVPRKATLIDMFI